MTMIPRVHERIRGDQLGHGLDGREFIEVTREPAGGAFMLVTTSGPHSPVVTLGPSDWADVIRNLRGELVGETEARCAYLARSIELQTTLADRRSTVGDQPK